MSGFHKIGGFSAFGNTGEPKVLNPFTHADFPVVASGYNVYRRTESSPICTCAELAMATEIAKRLNRDNQVYPEDK